MKNFFDIATPEEIKASFGAIPKGKVLAFDRETCDLDKDYNLAKLYLLFVERGDTANAELCLNQIESVERRLEATMLVHECVNA